MDQWCSKDGRILLLHGDARELRPNLGPSFVVITDPPFGVAHKAKAVKGFEADWDGEEIEGDRDVTVRDAVLDPYEDVFAFGDWRAPALPRAHTAVIWHKGPHAGGMNFHAPWKNCWEMGFVRGHAFKGGMDEGVLQNMWIPSWQSAGRIHQHQKPVKLIAYLIGKAPDAELVFDPFMGSGTAAIASMQMGRRFVGVEIDDSNFRNCVKRCKAEERQPRMFGMTDEPATQMELLND